MKSNNKNIEKFIDSWKSDFEEPNPFMSEKIMDKIQNANQANKSPIFIFTKAQMAFLLIFGFVIGLALQLIISQNSFEMENKASEEAYTKYTKEMYISDMRAVENEFGLLD
jgi:hypothetical protein